MLKNKPFVIVLTIVLAAVTAAFILIPQPDATAGQSRMIQILGREAPIIEPPILQIEKGTTVVWWNDAKAEIRIVFQDGKSCADVTEAPSQFSMDTKSCYVTTWLPFGSTSSLRFTESGVFEYSVEYSGRKKASKARIVVK